MILITGSNGQLGTDFKKIFNCEGLSYIATDIEELDITDAYSIDKFFQDNSNIDVVINCAAYNDVDKAEIEIEECKKLNYEAPINLMKKCKEIGAVFVTYSTDFVYYNEKKVIPIEEEKMTNPPSVYSMYKNLSEKIILLEYNKVFVIITSWMLGLASDNFVKQVIRWGKDKYSLSIVDDQISTPTYSLDLAYYSWKLIKTNKYGLYNITNSGECSKYEQAKYILSKIGWKGSLIPAKTSDFDLKAKRSYYSKLSTKKIETTIQEKIPTWDNAIDRFLQVYVDNYEEIIE